MPPLIRNGFIASLARSTPVRGAAGLAVLLVLAGCEAQGNMWEKKSPLTATDSAQPATPEEGAAGAGASEPAAQAAPPLKIASWEEITSQVAAVGRPAVLDVWALSCEPCLDEFPGLVRLHKELGDQVACFSANIEFDGRKTRPPESYRERVDAFLRRVGATMPNFISSTPSDEIYTAADIDSIPAVIVYAADGSIAKKFVDAGDSAGFTYDKDVIPLVRELLAKGKASRSPSGDR